MSRLDEALRLAGLGWRVLPVALGEKPGGRVTKTPLIRAWQRAASSDPDAVRAMPWDRADAVGVALPEGVAAVDVDDPAAFAAAGLEVPETPGQGTRSGGYHRLYSTDGREVRQTVREVPGADTRVGPKGFVVAWEPWSFGPGDLAPAPEWMYAPRRDTEAPEGPDGPFEPIGRRDQIMAYVGSWRAAGMEREDIYAVLARWRNEGRIVDLDRERPWTAQDLRKIATEAGAWPRGEVHAMPTIKMVRQERVIEVTTPEAAVAALRETFGPRAVAQAVAQRGTVSAWELIKNPPERPVEVIPGLLPAGLSLLASAPKVGKSWLAYQVAVAVATGGEVLGRQAVKGDVLYLALEDGEYRAYSRITSILRRTAGSGGRPEGSAELDVRFISGRGDEMVAEVEAWLETHPGARAVLIDTLQRVRPRATGKQTQYALDVEDAARVQAIAQRHPGIAVQVVHHDTKASRAPGADFVDAVSGTSGIAGSVDAILVLRRKRHESTGTLEVTGKDIREGLLWLAYDEGEPLWTIDPKGGLTDEQREAFEWLKANGPAGAAAVGEGLGRERTATQKMLDRMATAGMLRKEAGRFDVPIRVNPINNNDDTHVTDSTDVTDGTHGTDESAMSAMSAIPHTRGTRRKIIK